jgi:hypothetical protein
MDMRIAVAISIGTAGRTGLVRQKKLHAAGLEGLSIRVEP